MTGYQLSNLPPSFVRLLFEVTVFLSVAFLVTFALRRASAALRHRVWCLSMAGVLVLPVGLVLLPGWELGVLDARKKLPAQPTDDVQPAVDAPVDDPVLSKAAIARPTKPLVMQDVSTPHRPDPHRSSAPPTVMEGPLRAISKTAGLPRRDLMPVAIAGIWLAGTLFFLARALRSIRVSRQLVSRADTVDDPACWDLFTQLARRFGLHREPGLRQSREIVSPLCVGWRRPHLLLPSGWQTWQPDHLRAALAHEVAHVARADVAWQLLARLASAVYWFHPLVWLAAWRMRVEREAACDDCVLNLGERPSHYARLLLKLSSELSSRPALPSGTAVAMAGAVKMERRIRAVLRSDLSRTPVNRSVGRILAVGALGFLMFVGILSPHGPSEVEGNQLASAKEPPKTGIAATDSSPGPAAANETESTTQKKTPKSQPATPAVAVAGHVVDEQGSPVAGAQVGAKVYDAPQTARTAADGSFQIEVPKERLKGLMLHALHDGGARQAFFQFDYTLKPSEPLEPVRLVLRDAREIPIRVTDGQGHAIADARVAATVLSQKFAQAESDAAGEARLRVPIDAPLQYVLALKPNAGLDYYVYRGIEEPASDPYKLPSDHTGPIEFVLNGTQTVTVRVVDAQDQPMAGVRVYPWYFEKPRKGGDLNVSGLSDFKKATDQRGVATFQTIPADNTRRINFWTQAEGYYAPKRHLFDPKSGDSEQIARLVPLVPLTGRVSFPDGRPAAGIEIQAAGDGYQLDGFRGATHTAEDGTFEFEVYPNQYYLVVPTSKEWAGPGQARVVLETPVEGIDFTLEPSRRVYGRVTVGADRKPLIRQFLVLHQNLSNRYEELPEAQPLPNPTGNRKVIYPIVGRTLSTEDEGRFEFFVGPGNYYLIGPKNSETPKFVITDEKTLEVNLHAPQPDSLEITGRVVLKDDPDKSVPEASVEGVPIQPRVRKLRAVTDSRGQFRAERGVSDMVVFAASPDRLLAGIVKIEAEDPTVTIPIRPTASARGRLVDANGKPLAGRQIDYGVQIVYEGGSFNNKFGGSTTTDATGAFRLSDLVVGWEYTLDVAIKRDAEGRPYSRRQAATVKPAQTGLVDLGEVRFAETDRLPAP